MVEEIICVKCQQPVLDCQENGCISKRKIYHEGNCQLCGDGVRNDLAKCYHSDKLHCDDCCMSSQGCLKEDA